MRSCIGSPERLASCLQTFTNASVQENVYVVSLGDEITVSGGNTSDPVFAQWCQSKKLTPQQVGCSSWAACHVNTSIVHGSSSAAAAANFYYSTIFVQQQALGHFKTITDTIQKTCPNAKVGANFSPTMYFVDPRDQHQYCHAYLGTVFQWIQIFRAGALTLVSTNNNNKKQKKKNKKKKEKKKKKKEEEKGEKDCENLFRLIAVFSSASTVDWRL